MAVCELTVVVFDIPATLVAMVEVVVTAMVVMETVVLVLFTLDVDAELILGMRGRLERPLSLGFKNDKTELRGFVEFLPKDVDDCPLLDEFNDLEEFKPLLLPDREGELLFRSLEYFPFELLDIPKDDRLL